MLYGVDISHHDSTRIATGELDLSKQDFVIMKATEGRTYQDPKLYLYMSKVETARQGIGFYHYARPELNNSINEADNFLFKVGHTAGKALFALDVEGKALTLQDDDLAEWVLSWCRYVKRETGVLPLVYTGTEGLQKIGEAILAENIGLWFARYRRKLEKSMYKPYPFWALWQYTETPYDRDKFNGTLEQWNKYCEAR